MRRYELEDYNTIQPKPTYRSPIVRNRTLRNQALLNIKEKNEMDHQNEYDNKIEKSYTKSIPVHTFHDNIQTAREYSRILEQKEPKETKPKNKIRKNLSSYDIFVPKNSKKGNQSSNHFTFNDMKKKKRNSSVAVTKPSQKSMNDFNYVCNNCYNMKIVTKKYKEQPPEKKDILNNTFTKANPFYFQDKMKEIYKDQIQNKIKEIEKLQRIALNNLAKYKIENPTNVERLQKQQELCMNSMVGHEREDPRINKTLRSYDLKENFINKNKEIYQIDKPRKAINDYYKKCCFQVPIIEDDYFVDKKYIKQVSIDLREQIEDKRLHKKKQREEEILTERISNKQMDDYSEYLCRKNKEQKKNYFNEFYQPSKYVDDFRKYKNENLQKNRQSYLDKISQRMKKEDEDKKNKCRQKKINAINKLQTWKNDFEIEKKNRKREKEEENHKWYNYSQDYIAKCIHGNDVTKCCLCDQAIPKEKMIKYGGKSTDVSIVSSKEATSQYSEKV